MNVRVSNTLIAPLILSLFLLGENFNLGSINIGLYIIPCVGILFLLAMRRYRFSGPIFLYLVFLLIVLFALSSLSLVRGGVESFWWADVTLAAIGFLIVFDGFYRSHPSQVGRYLAVILLVVLCALATVYEGGRFRFGFGPNMLYRLVLCLFVIGLFFGPKLNFVKILALVGLTSYLLIQIGSRGGVLIFFICLFLLFTSSKNFLITALGSLASGVALIWSVLSGFGKELFGRVFYINLENASEAYRLAQYREFIDFFINAEVFSIFFGSGVGGAPYEAIYPHNILLESFVWYGVFFGLVICLLLITSVVVCFRGGGLYRGLWAILILPTFLSGSIFDNVVAIGFLCACFVWLCARRGLPQLGIVE